MKATRRAWIVRPNPHHEPRFTEFLRDEVVALGWPGLGSLAGKELLQIKEVLAARYRPKDRRDLGRSAGLLNTFVNLVSSGDWVLVPRPADGAVQVGEFRGGYIYNRAKEDDGYPHQRRVAWLFGELPIPRKRLPARVRETLRAQQPIIATHASDLVTIMRAGAASEQRARQAVRAMAHDPDTDGSFFGVEGEVVQVLRSLPLRDRKLREGKIAHALKAGGGRLICEVPGCAFDFEAVYGRLGRHFAHVHHLKQFGGTKGTRVTSERDLKIVCANCHAMVHRYGECRRIERLIRSARVSKTQPKSQKNE